MSCHRSGYNCHIPVIDQTIQNWYTDYKSYYWIEHLHISDLILKLFTFDRSYFPLRTKRFYFMHNSMKITYFISVICTRFKCCKARYTRYKFCIQVSIQDNLNSSLCIHDARNFDDYTQVLAGDTTNKMAFLRGEEGAALCIALLCTIVLRRRLSSKKRSTWACKWFRRRWWDVFPWSLLDLQSFH